MPVRLKRKGTKGRSVRRDAEGEMAVGDTGGSQRKFHSEGDENAKERASPAKR